MSRRERNLQKSITKEARIVTLPNGTIDVSFGCTVDKCSKKEDDEDFTFPDHQTECHERSVNFVLHGVLVKFIRDNGGQQDLRCICGKKFAYHSELYKHVTYKRAVRGLDCRVLEEAIVMFIIDMDDETTERTNNNWFGVTLRRYSSRMRAISESSEAACEDLNDALIWLQMRFEAIQGSLTRGDRLEQILDQIDDAYHDIHRRISTCQKELGMIYKLAHIEIAMKNTN